MTYKANTGEKNYGLMKKTESRERGAQMKKVSFYRDAKRKKRESEALFR